MFSTFDRGQGSRSSPPLQGPGKPAAAVHLNGYGELLLSNQTPELSYQQSLDNAYTSSFGSSATEGSLSLLDGVNNFFQMVDFYFYDSANNSLWSSELGGSLQSSVPYGSAVSEPGAFLQAFSLPDGYVALERLTLTSIANVTPTLAGSKDWTPLTSWGNDVLLSGEVGSFPVLWVANGTTLKLELNVTSDFPADFSWIAGTTQSNGTVITTGYSGTAGSYRMSFATFSFVSLRFRYLQEENVPNGNCGENAINQAIVGESAYFGGGLVCPGGPFGFTFNMALLYSVNETTEAVTNLTSDLPTPSTYIEDVAPFGNLVGVTFTTTPNYVLGATPFYTIDTATGTATNITSQFPELSAYGLASQGAGVALIAGSAFGNQADLAVVNQTTLAIQEFFGPPPPIGSTGTSLVWSDQTVAGGGGFLTVGGNGLVFYNSTSGQFQAPTGNLSSVGYVQGAAWDGKQFLVVGEGFVPKEGLLAYLYNPSDNDLTEITSDFPRGLTATGSGAAFLSVLWNGSAFLLLGQTNSSGQGPSQPLVFSFSPATSQVTNETSVARAVSLGSAGTQYADLLSAAGSEFVFEAGLSGAYGLWEVSSSLAVTNLSGVLASTPYQFNGSSDSVTGGIHGPQVSVLDYASGMLYILGNDPSNHSAEVVAYNGSLGIVNGTRAFYLPTEADLTTSAFLGEDLLVAGWQSTGPGAPSLFAWNATTDRSQNLTAAVPSSFLMPGSLAVGSGGAFVSGGVFPSPPLFGVLGRPFNLTFQESGLPSGTSWGVELPGVANDTTTSPGLVLTVTNGSYPFSMIPIPRYHATPSSGTLHVLGAPLTESVTFTSVLYPVTFHEGGLPSGASWGVQVPGVGSTNTTSTSLTLDLFNGSYTFLPLSPAGYHASPSSGSFSVAGQGVSLSLSFAEVLYPVVFRESGLSGGARWGVVVSSVEVNSTGSNLTLSLANGTYPYRVLSPPGFLPSPSQGSFSVSGAGVSVPLLFSPALFAVSFYATGLLPGSSWWVNVSGLAPAQGNSSGPIVLDLTNGSYSYTVGAAPFYQVSPQNGSFRVAGQAERFNLSFEALSPLTLQVSPAGAQVTIGTRSLSPNSTGTYQLRLVPGSYYVNASAPGYYAYSDLVTLTPGSTTRLSIALTSLPLFGWLAGTVSPGNASVIAGGHAVPVSSSGAFNVSLAPGETLVEATAAGHGAFTQELNISAHRTTTVNIVLPPTTSTVEVRGVVHPSNTSVTFDGLAAYVNGTGFYFIWLPVGSYDASFYAPSYLPYDRIVNLTSTSWINVTLTSVPPATSQSSQGNVSVTGYSVQVNSVSSSSGTVSVNFTASATGNGTLEIQVPLASLANATIAEVLASKVYVNGLPYQNFTITITSSGLVILTVRGVKGDPVLRWVVHPSSSPPPASPSPSPLPGWLLPAIVGAVVVVGIVAGVWAWKRGRRGRATPPTAPAPPTPPSR